MTGLLLVGTKKQFNYYVFDYIPRFFRTYATPLDQSILCSETVVKKFKEKNKLQIVNVVFLTDGQSNSDIGFYNLNREVELLVGVFSDTNNKIIIRDNVSKQLYEWSKTKRGNLSYNDFVKILLEILKSRLNCNLIGFHISDIVPYWIGENGDDAKLCKSLGKSLRKEGVCVINGHGYDDLFVISPKSNKYYGKNSRKAALGTMDDLAKDFILERTEALRGDTKILTRFIDLVSGKLF